MSEEQNSKRENEEAPNAQPILNQHGRPLQEFGTLVDYPLALPEEARRLSVSNLNQILADTIYLRDSYKKAHWQVTGPTFYQMHLLFDQHFDEQDDLVDMLGERVQKLGGVTVALPHDVAHMTRLERLTRDREELPVMLSNLLRAHETILRESHEAAQAATKAGDDGTTDLLVTNIIRANEKQVWFISAHLANAPLVRAT